MPVFKLCMKIIKKNLPSMLIYVGVFLLVSLFVSSTSTKTQTTNFAQVKSSIAFISEESSPLIDGLKQQLGKTTILANIPDNTEKLQDALYFRNVEYIVRIPKGFTERFMRGETVQIQKTIVPSSITSAFIDLNINQYFNTARLYLKNVKGITQAELVEHLAHDLGTYTPVELKSAGQSNANHGDVAQYFSYNYLAYSLFSVLILGISSIMIVFNNRDLQWRNFCSPIHAGSFNLQFMLANLLFSLACWVILVSFCFMLNSKSIFSVNTLYYLLNSFVFTLCGSSIGFLIGNLIKGREAISAVCNVVTLGPCFISGVFVPQEFLNSTVLKIASFTPTYWYVKANSQIAVLINFNYSNLIPVFSNIMVEFGFAIAFFALSLVVGKNKRMST